MSPRRRQRKLVGTCQGGEAAGTLGHVKTPVCQEQTPLRWLLLWDTVQAPAGLAPAPARCYCCSVFGKGLSPHPSLPSHPPHMGATSCVEHFPLSSAEIHPEGQGPAKGPIHHKRSCFHFPGQGDENKQNKCRAPPPPLRPPPSAPENNHPFYRNFTAKSLNVIIIIISLLKIV